MFTGRVLRRRAARAWPMLVWISSYWSIEKPAARNGVSSDFGHVPAMVPGKHRDPAQRLEAVVGEAIGAAHTEQAAERSEKRPGSRMLERPSRSAIATIDHSSADRRAAGSTPSDDAAVGVDGRGLSLLAARLEEEGWP